MQAHETLPIINLLKQTTQTTEIKIMNNSGISKAMIKTLEMQEEALFKMIDLMGIMRKSGCDLDSYTEEMHNARAKIHSARIAITKKITEAKV